MAKKVVEMPKGKEPAALTPAQTKALFQAQAKMEKTGAALAEANAAVKSAKSDHKVALDERNNLISELRDGQVGMFEA